MNNLSINGEKIEELQSLASQNLFMHAQQINDWAGDLRIFVKESQKIYMGTCFLSKFKKKNLPQKLIPLSNWIS